MQTYAVIDFETTGLSPDYGARATEIAAVLVCDGQLVDRYQSLMNAGLRVPAEIQQLTGISTAMVRQAPPVDVVMREVADFVGDRPLVAHNAAFDKKFWDAELSRIGRTRRHEFACSMLLARRLFPDAPNHKLGNLIARLHLPVTGRYHRALADAEATAHLFVHLQHELKRRFALDEIDHALLLAAQKSTAAKLPECIARHLKKLQKKPMLSAKSD
ncbi:MAG TPA: 3'-5' exonuclease [Rhodocyclaceae bacterium]|nr:3'-5' exonuclease [Rhodocyclaceae bacterium]